MNLLSMVIKQVGAISNKIDGISTKLNENSAVTPVSATAPATASATATTQAAATATPVATTTKIADKTKKEGAK